MSNKTIGALRLGVAAAGAMLVSGTVMAADLPARTAPPVFVPPPVALPSWTGFYVGAAGGADFVHNSFRTESLATGFLTDGTDNAGLGKTSGKIGGFVGYNLQISSYVVGVEGDAFYNFSSSRTIAGVPGTIALVNGFAGSDSDTTFARSRYDASIRGRVGYLITPTLLLYATGGVAFRDGTYGINCPANGTSFCSQPESMTFKTNLVGYTVGGGLEYKLSNNLSIRADYRYSDFGHRHLDFFPPPSGISGDYFGVNTHQNASSVTVGLAYRFDALAPAAPVVARY